MSLPNSPGTPEDRTSQQSLSRFIRRASKVLRPRSNRDSLASQSDLPAGVPSTEAGAVVAQVKPRMTPPSVGQTKPAMSSMAHLKEREEKARALFAKYGLKLEPGEWTTPRTSDSQWVEKKVVMRVHRHCHRCQTAFGNDKTCANCSHTRCKKCPRFPTKRPKEQREKEAASAAAAATTAGAGGAGAVAVEAGRPTKTKIQLTMPSRFNQDMVRREPVQRVRRTCHKCDMLFVGKATECAGCKHQRCPNCPRDPPKKKKYPDGYPGDVEETFPLAQRTYRHVRLRCRWECHACSTYFIQGEKSCRSCQHERCEQCPRHPPKKEKPPPNPDVVQSLEEKLGKMMVSPATAA